MSAVRSICEHSSQLGVLAGYGKRQWLAPRPGWCLAVTPVQRDTSRPLSGGPHCPVRLSLRQPVGARTDLAHMLASMNPGGSAADPHGIQERVPPAPRDALSPRDKLA